MAKDVRKFKKLLSGLKMEGECKRYKKDTLKVLLLQEDFSKMTDEELKLCAKNLKERVQNGEKLENVKHESFALIREVSKRILGKEHYPVQVLGAFALLDGNIAEMGTGEGKTLMSLLPAFLNSLTGENVHIITSNEYLAQRDCEMASKVFGFLGVSCGVSLSKMSVKDKQEAYSKDITYVTASEVGFDYLRDNLCVDPSQRVLRGLNYALIDEVDNILLDEGSTPLVISQGSTKTRKDIILQARKFIETLNSEDYEKDVEKNTIELTESGMNKAQEFFGVGYIYKNGGEGEEEFEEDNSVILERAYIEDAISNALRAEFFLKKDDDYIVVDNRVEIVGKYLGRVMEGRQFSYGLHQALQAKEGVTITNEMSTTAQITVQNFFGLYKDKAGMTGTAKEDREEFESGFNMGVVRIPQNKERKRVDYELEVYYSKESKYRALVTKVKNRHKNGQPVLIGVGSVEESLIVSQLLENEGLPHNVLNAKTGITNSDAESKLEEEDFYIAQAGRKGAITVATNMAGRGTDILLGGNPTYLAKEQMIQEGYSKEEIALAESNYDTEDEKVLQLREHFVSLKNDFSKITSAEKKEVEKVGGLSVIGTNLNVNRRIDNQLIGRSGRGGDVGETRIMCSLDDEILLENAPDRYIKSLKATYRGGVHDINPIASKSLIKIMYGAQRREESKVSNYRSFMRGYGKVQDIQRKRFYNLRNESVESKNFTNEFKGLVKFFAKNILEDKNYIQDSNLSNDEKRVAKVKKICEFCGLEFDELEKFVFEDDEKLADLISQKVIEKNKEFLKENIEKLRIHWLKKIDKTWGEFLEISNFTTMTANLSFLGSQNPILSYQKYSDDMLIMMIEDAAKFFVADKCKEMQDYKEKQKEEKEKNVSSKLKESEKISVVKTKEEKKEDVTNEEKITNEKELKDDDVELE